MARKRSRDRHLAKLAARRQAEIAARRRRRSLILGSIIGVLVIGGAAYGAVQVFGGNEAAAKRSPSPSASTSPTPKGKPKQTGTVSPAVKPPKKVACGAIVPKGAGEKKPQFSNAPSASTIDPEKTYTATIATSCGMIEVQLDAKQTPLAVANFVFLAKQGFYDGLTFHRVVKGFVIQAGDPLGNGQGGPGYKFATEVNAGTKFADKGDWLAYANSGPDTNASQFFITTGPQPNLDQGGPYTLFGKVVGGEDVVAKIAALPTTTGPYCAGATEKCATKDAVYIDSVTVTEK